jgi:hypothetical protein
MKMRNFFETTIQTIIFFLIASCSFGQLKTTQTFSVRNGWCSTTFIIDSLGTFCREQGCEGSSHIACGTYQLKADKITFIFNKLSDIPPFSKIQETSRLNDTTIKVTFRTCDNNVFRHDYFIVDAIDTSGRFFKSFYLNDSGEIVIVDPIKYKSLRLNYLQNFYGKWIYIDLNENNMQVFLSFPKEFFYYSNPIPESDKTITLILKTDGLYDIDGKENIIPLNK